MANVTLSIGGNDYAVTCADGEEAHLRHMGDMIEEKASTVRASVGHLNAERQLLFAALLLADEVSDARARPETGAAPSQSAHSNPVDEAPLLHIAERLEALAAALEAAA